MSPTYSAVDLHAAEQSGYLRGFHDGRTALDAETAAQAHAFADLARRIFRDPLPFHELQARRDGYDSRSASRAREVHAELLDAVRVSTAGSAA